MKILYDNDDDHHDHLNKTRRRCIRPCHVEDLSSDKRLVNFPDEKLTIAPSISQFSADSSETCKNLCRIKPSASNVVPMCETVVKMNDSATTSSPHSEELFAKCRNYSNNQTGTHHHSWKRRWKGCTIGNLLLKKSNIFAINLPSSNYSLILYLIVIFLCIIGHSPVTANSPPQFVLSEGQSEIVLRLKEGPETPAGSLIYRLKGYDPDDDPLTFGLRGQIANELLRIENVRTNEANVYLKKELDREVRFGSCFLHSSLTAPQLVSH